MNVVFVSFLVLSAAASNAAVTVPVTDSMQAQCWGKTGGVMAPCPTSGQETFGQDAQYSGLQSAFCGSSDVVLDRNTGLYWTRNLLPKMTAAAAATAASSFSLGGFSDWRLPTVSELYSLIEFNGETGSSETTNKPYINTTFFQTLYGNTAIGERFIDGQLWTSSKYKGTVMGGSECHFGLNFIDGRIKCYPILKGPPGMQEDNKLFVRLVRGNSNYAAARTFTASNRIVTDSATGLKWQQDDSGYGMDWPAALAFCEALSLGGHTDWRLPDAHELQSIVDYSRSPDTTSSPAIDAIFNSTGIVNKAGQADFPWYWTSTTHIDGAPLGSAGVYVAFGRATGNFSNTPGSPFSVVDVHGAGAQRSDPKTGSPNDPKWATGRGPQGDIVRINNYVRCVRGSSSAIGFGLDCPASSALRAAPVLGPWLFMVLAVFLFHS